MGRCIARHKIGWDLWCVEKIVERLTHKRWRVGIPALYSTWVVGWYERVLHIFIVASIHRIHARPDLVDRGAFRLVIGIRVVSLVFIVWLR